jgi:hypothetical protein
MLYVYIVRTYTLSKNVNGIMEFYLYLMIVVKAHFYSCKCIT